MALTFTQTDSTTGACDTGDNAIRRCANGETAGSSAVTVTITATSTEYFSFSCIVGSGISGDSGTWTVPLRVTGSNMNLSLNSSFVTAGRYNSACVGQSIVGSGFSWDSSSLSSTGVKTLTFTGSSQTLTAGDVIYIRIGVQNGAMTNQSFDFTPDQNIDSPFTEAVAANIDAQPGSFSITGVAATLAASKLFNAAPGSFSVTGVDATLAKGFQVNAEPGSHTITGVDATFVKDSAIPADPGSHTLTGVDATLAAGKVFNAEPGTYSIAGVDATFALGYAMNAETASFIVTGIDASLITDRAINAETGSYGVTGVDATLEYTPVGAYTLNAEPGSFTVSGVAANFTAERMLSADTGIYALSGVDATLTSVSQTQEVVRETPAGRSRRRRDRIIARYKGSEYLFDSPEQLQDFIDSVRTPGQKKRGKKPSVKIVVPHGIEKELSSFDLPSLQKALSEFDFSSAIRLWNRYESLKNQKVNVEQSREFREQQALRMQIELEDEELLLL